MNSLNSVFIQTYGCTLNQADSDIMKAILYDKGFEISTNEEESDVVILNTCTVKGATENKIIAKMQKLKKENKKIVIAGCLSVNTEKIRRILPNSPIVWAGAAGEIGNAVDAALDNRYVEFKQGIRKEGLPKFFTAPILRIPISEGCVSFCHFCQTKLARPGLRSVSIKAIVEWIKHGVTNGAREVQLTSMDAGAYGLDLKKNVVELMETVNDIDAPFYARMAMANPNHIKRMKAGVIKNLNGKRFYKFLHVPVQSGSEKVAKEMNRNHSVKDFVDIVNDFRSVIPEISIMTDIIVGYPTETEDDFNETLEMLKDTKIDVVNVSKFSPRPKTKAATLMQLDNDEIKRRSTLTSELVKKISAQKNKELIGKTYDVLISEKQKDYTGRNINYKQVVVKGFKGKLGETVKVKITDSNYGSLFGDIF